MGALRQLLRPIMDGLHSAHAKHNILSAEPNAPLPDDTPDMPLVLDVYMKIAPRNPAHFLLVCNTSHLESLAVFEFRSTAELDAFVTWCEESPISAAHVRALIRMQLLPGVDCVHEPSAAEDAQDMPMPMNMHSVASIKNWKKNVPELSILGV